MVHFRTLTFSKLTQENIFKFGSSKNGVLPNYIGRDAAVFMDACKLYRLGTVRLDSKEGSMESLAYENATPVDVGPPPLRGDVCILGRRYSLPGGAFPPPFCLFIIPTSSTLCQSVISNAVHCVV